MIERRWVTGIARRHEPGKRAVIAFRIDQANLVSALRNAFDYTCDERGFPAAGLAADQDDLPVRLQHNLAITRFAKPNAGTIGRDVKSREVILQQHSGEFYYSSPVIPLGDQVRFFLQ